MTTVSDVLLIITSVASVVAMFLAFFKYALPYIKKSKCMGVEVEMREEPSENHSKHATCNEHHSSPETNHENVQNKAETV